MIFTIRVYGVDEAAETLESFGHQALYARPALEEIHLTMLDIEHEAFEKEGARSGFTKWQKLALSTIIRKVKRKMDPRILQESGRLMRAMTHYRSPDAYTRIEATRIIFQPKSTAIPYGRIQKRGGHAGGANIPARDYIRFSALDRRAFAKEMMRHLASKRGSGRIGVTFNG